MGRTTGRDTQAQESTTQRGMGMGGDKYDSSGRRGVGDEFSSGRGGDEMGFGGLSGREGGIRRDGGLGRESDLGREGGMGRTGENRGVDDEFVSSRDPMLGKQHGTSDTYGQRSAREDTQRTTGAMGGSTGTAGLAGSDPDTMGGGRQKHTSSGLAGGVPGDDLGDDPMMSGRDQSSNKGTGLGGVSGMDSGRRDDQSYGGAYAGGGQPREKRDSFTGKMMEKAGGILGNSKMEEKGHEKREARQRQE